MGTIQALKRLSKYFFIKIQGKDPKYLYHFTDSRNIPNIKSIGLYSFAYLKDELKLNEDEDFFPSSNFLSRSIDYFLKHNANLLIILYP